MHGLLQTEEIQMQGPVRVHTGKGTFGSGSSTTHGLVLALSDPLHTHCSQLERSERRATSPLSAISEEDDESDDEDSSPNAFKFRGPPMSYGSDDFFGAFSLARSIDKVSSPTHSLHSASDHCSSSQCVLDRLA